MSQNQLERTQVFLDSTIGTVFYLFVSIVGLIGLFHQSVYAVASQTANANSFWWTLNGVSLQLFTLSAVVSLVSIPLLLIAGHLHGDNTSLLLTVGGGIWSLLYSLTAIFISKRNIGFMMSDIAPIGYQRGLLLSFQMNRVLVAVVILFSVVVALYSIIDSDSL